MSSNNSISYSPVPPSEQTPRPVQEDLESSDPVSEAPPGYFMGPFLPWSKDSTTDESSIRIIGEIVADNPEEGTINLDDSEMEMQLEVTIVIPSDGEDDEEEPGGLPAATSTPLPPFSPPNRSLFAIERTSVDFSSSSELDEEDLFGSPTPSEKASIDAAYRVECYVEERPNRRRPREDVMDKLWRQSEKCEILEEARDALQEWLAMATPPLPRRRRVMNHMFGLDLEIQVGEKRLRQLHEEAGLEQLAGATVTPSPDQEK